MTPLEEARQLLHAAAEETQYRTVASRAYFAAFNLAKEFALAYGFQPVRAADDHKNLSQHLRAHHHALLNRIGIRLGSMRVLRNRADYDMAVQFTQQWAMNVVQDADMVETWISNVTAAAGKSAATGTAGASNSSSP